MIEKEDPFDTYVPNARKIKLTKNQRLNWDNAVEIAQTLNIDPPPQSPVCILRFIADNTEQYLRMRRKNLESDL